MKIFISIILIIILFLNLAINIDENVMKIHDEVFQRAMISFGLAKGLNAVISLIQGTELSFTPVGIGLNFSIGEVLDPFNDMVERFSWVMLISSISLGVQKVLLLLGSKLFLQVSLVLSVIISMTFVWIKKLHINTFFLLPFKILFLLIILRFGTVVSVYASEYLYTTTLQEQYTESTKVIKNTKVKLDEINSNAREIQNIKKDNAWYEFKSRIQLDIGKKLDNARESIEEASNNIINLITIFIIQTIILPLIFLWFMIISVKLIFKIKLNTDRIIQLL